MFRRIAYFASLVSIFWVSAWGQSDFPCKEGLIPKSSSPNEFDYKKRSDDLCEGFTQQQVSGTTDVIVRGFTALRRITEATEKALYLRWAPLQGDLTVTLEIAQLMQERRYRADHVAKAGAQSYRWDLSKIRAAKVGVNQFGFLAVIPSSTNPKDTSPWAKLPTVVPLFVQDSVEGKNDSSQLTMPTVFQLTLQSAVTRSGFEGTISELGPNNEKINVHSAFLVKPEFNVNFLLGTRTTIPIHFSRPPKGRYLLEYTVPGQKKTDNPHRGYVIFEFPAL